MTCGSANSGANGTDEKTPSIAISEDGKSLIFSAVTLEAMEMVLFTVPSRPIGFFYSFFEECRNNPAFAAYPIPMLILQGEEDSYINRDDIQNFARINDQSKLVIIPGASHRFLEPGAWDMVLDLTRDWFAYEQVLLAESI